MDFCKGMIVRSRAGRDAGRWCVIIGLEENFALIADGDLRSLEKPKRKKLMHLAPTRTVLEEQDYPTNNRLKQVLAAFGRPGPMHEGGQELV
jgi:ribosomal protein L14E/L6E/L27E